ncbi:MAG: pyridoxal phosphate-dependent decarboxylase family protein [Aliihoeflea sp.]
MDVRREMLAQAQEDTLDPDDWGALAALAHKIVDDGFAHMATLRERPAWRDLPGELAEIFSGPPPRAPQPLSEVLETVGETVMSYPMGNSHPRFWAWYMGAGNMTGALADFIAAVQASNLGGGKHAAALVDQQVVDWLRQMVGFPDTASGTLVSGGSIANLIGLTVARNLKAGIDIRELGIGAVPRPLRFYGSDQLHSCHRKAVETLGLGNRALRRIPSDASWRIDISALREAIAEDRAAGFRPACIIASAGTVNTGSIDDLNALADLAAEEALWFHVDGCIGALIAIAPGHRELVDGLSRADSLALDPHKWLHAPFDVGCCLVRNAAAHRGAFSTFAEYLATSERGLASGVWLYELGLQTSRGFRALKVWMALKEHGVDKFGRLIDQNIDMAHYLTRLVETEPTLSLTAPTVINIVCFRFDPGGLGEPALKALNTEIMLRLQESGIAVLTDTTLRGHHSLRAAICNHRTRYNDLNLVVGEIVRIGKELTA